MNFIIWTPQEIATLVEMSNTSATSKEIYEYMLPLALADEPGYPVVRSIKAIERKKEKLIAAASDKQFATEESVDSKWLAINSIQKQYLEASKFLATGIVKPERKILSLSDIHFPFARTDFLHQAIKDHADADILVLNGDIFEGYIFSTFTKDKTVAAIDEYICVFDFVDMCRRKFKKVVLVGGNHDVRAEKAIKRTDLPPDAMNMFGTDLLARIANGERISRDGKLIEKLDMSNVFYSPTEAWWVQIGKTLFIHPHSRGSSKPAYTVSAWAKKFQDRLPPGSFDSIVSGHTHQASKHIQSNLLLIEQGCLCNYMSYSWQPRDIYHSSAMNGYAVIYQDKEGNTDFNASTFVYLGQLLPVDKAICSSTSGYKNKDILLA